MLQWLITAAALLALLFYWLHTVRKELQAEWEAVLGADKQVRLYWSLLKDTKNDPEKQVYMKEHYNECCSIYTIQAKKYLSLRNKGLRPPAALLLGYPKIPEKISFIDN